MEHPLRVDELPHTDTPAAVTAKPPPAPLAAPAAALPPLPNLSASDVLLLRPSDRPAKAVSSRPERALPPPPQV